MRAQHIPLPFILLIAINLSPPLWGATSSGAQPPSPASEPRSKSVAKPQGAQPATSSSPTPTPGSAAQPTKAPLPTKATPSRQVSTPPSASKSQGAATWPTPNPKSTSLTKASAKGPLGARPGAVQGQITGASKASRVATSYPVGGGKAARYSDSPSRKPASRPTPTKTAVALAPTPSARPSFTRLPVIDLSTSNTAPPGLPLVRSGSVLVVDASGEELYAKNPDALLPIASITKLMTAMVVLDSGAPLHELITISAADRDWIRGSSSRLQDGRATLSRLEMLQLALMSSENRAAAALARTTFPGGTQEFVAAMNRKAQSLGMTRSHFADGTGLDGNNTSTARDLVRMLRAAYEYPEIRQATTTESAQVQPYGEFRSLSYLNTNRLVRGGAWDIELSKTGYLNEAGRCLAMRTRIEDRPLYMVFLNAPGKLTPFEDSNRLRRWLESRS